MRLVKHFKITETYVFGELDEMFPAFFCSCTGLEQGSNGEYDQNEL